MGGKVGEGAGRGLNSHVASHCPLGCHLLA